MDSAGGGKGPLRFSPEASRKRYAFVMCGRAGQSLKSHI
ncbi:hypothetical protein SS05631_c39460 [Sinorhizobium sp. CCBAU 05631]|nr:hypothetical protein SS05631_c39460 [Sinorhizobium sp. CCBAU 05631]